MDQVDRPSFPVLVRRYAETLVMVGLATALGLAMAPRWGTSAVDLILLLPVLAAASLYGLRPALVAVIASTLAYNFFFTAPVHTFRIRSADDIVTVLVLFAVALVTSQLAARMRRQRRIAAANAARNATIAGFSRGLLSSASAADIGRFACRALAELFACNALLLTRQDEETQVLARWPEQSPLTPSDLAAAAWVLEYGQPAGRGTLRITPAEWTFHPVKTDTGILAAMGLARDDGRPAVPEERLELLTGLLDQIALALDRAALESAVRDVDQLRERDRLRHALLSSVGHDLRTPLTAILAAAAELTRDPAAAPRQALTALIDAEARRLERYVGNLLDMARIEAGAITLRAEPVDLIDAVSAATHDLRTLLDDRAVTIDLPSDLPLVRADPQLLHHILINLVDNAARYSPPQAPIAVQGAETDGAVTVSIVDSGRGLPAEGGAEILKRFRSLSGSDRKGGAGLGLAIVSGFAEAMGMGVSGANRADAQGAVFTLRFPTALLVDERSEETMD